MGTPAKPVFVFSGATATGSEGGSEMLSVDTADGAGTGNGAGTIVGAGTIAGGAATGAGGMLINIGSGDLAMPRDDRDEIGIGSGDTGSGAG